MIVIYDFVARSGRELSAQKGDQVTVVTEVSDKWIECELKGRQGTFPLSIFQTLQPDNIP